MEPLPYRSNSDVLHVGLHLWHSGTPAQPAGGHAGSLRSVGTQRPVPQLGRAGHHEASGD